MENEFGRPKNGVRDTRSTIVRLEHRWCFYDRLWQTITFLLFRSATLNAGTHATAYACSTYAIINYCNNQRTYTAVYSATDAVSHTAANARTDATTNSRTDSLADTTTNCADNVNCRAIIDYNLFVYCYDAAVTTFYN